MLIRVLGSAAGGGFPQWNCNCVNCRGVRAGTLRAKKRTQSSIAVSTDGSQWVVCNASPDIHRQMAAHPALEPRAGVRDSANMPMADPMPESREAIARIARLYRFQWEEAQDAYVLPFPEGMVNLNSTAGEILRRCNDQDSLTRIIADLEKSSASDSIGPDITAFLQSATQNGWIEWRDAVIS